MSVNNYADNLGSAVRYALTRLPQQFALSTRI
jgi:hypothetical protein